MCQSLGDERECGAFGVPLTQLGLGRVFVMFVAGDERKQLLHTRGHLEQVKG